MIRPVYTLCILFSLGFSAQGQINSDHINDEVLTRVSRSAANEKIYAHLNSQFLLAGETLLFKVYCVDRDNKLSDFSKVAYFELINDQGEPAFQGKIGLAHGMGHGDIFLPSNLKTGKYTLAV